MTIIRQPRVKLRTLDGWLDTAFGVNVPLPPPIPTPTGWTEAFATRQIDGTIRDWYVANVGHDPNLSYQTFVGNLTITDSWLSSNQGNGRVSFSDGRWYVERIHVQGICRVNTNNVTFDNLWVDGVNGILYGAQSQTNAYGLEFNHCTLDGAMVSGSTAVNFPDATEPDQVVFNYCDVKGFRAGLYSFGGLTFNYCYSHDLHYTEGSHNTGASVRGRNTTYRRCLVNDGNSAALSCYAETTPYTGILIQENAFKCQPGVGPEVLIGKQYAIAQPGETRIFVGNLLELGNVAAEGPNSTTPEFTAGSVGNIRMDGTSIVGF